MMMNDAVEDVTIFQAESDEDKDDQREHEDTCDLSSL